MIGNDFFNQLALVVDAFEKCELKTLNKTLLFELEGDIYNELYRKTQLMVNDDSEEITTSFTIKIGEIDIVFNMSNA
jgi:hypothetical protein